VSINAWRLAGDTLNITCDLLWCNHKVHREFLITLYLYLIKSVKILSTFYGSEQTDEIFFRDFRLHLRCKLDLPSSGMLRDSNGSSAHTASLLSTQSTLHTNPENRRSQTNSLFLSIIFIQKPTRLLSSKVTKHKEGREKEKKER
jgi:hypothetical protein